MTNLNNIIFYDNLPKLDLHGYDSQTAKVAIHDFIKDNQKMKKEVILFVHGNGSGLLRQVTHETLKRHKGVLEYKGIIGNPGCTVAKIKFDTK